MYAPNTNLAPACVRVRAYMRERITLRAKKKPLAHGVCERRVGLFISTRIFLQACRTHLRVSRHLCLTRHHHHLLVHSSSEPSVQHTSHAVPHVGHSLLSSLITRPLPIERLRVTGVRNRLM